MIQIEGLTAKQRMLADIIWSFNDKEAVTRFIKTLPVKDRREAQIAKRFGIKNPTATISVIRSRGYAVYANQRRAGNNVDVTEYRHGEASRKITALGYKALSLGITL